VAVFVELVLDDFQRTFNQQLESRRNGRRGGNEPPVRRPTRGLEVNDDTYAIMRVVKGDGSQIPLFDSGALDGSGKSTNYSNFLLQGVSEARMEKQQIVETFGASYVYFFGESPRFLDVQAILLSSLDFNWRSEWWENYDTYLRGTRLVEMGARCYLFYEDVVVEGYILNAQTQSLAEQPIRQQLQFRMFVTNYTNVSFIGDPFYPIRSGAVPPPGVADLTSMDAYSQLAPASSNPQNPEQQAQEAFLQALRSSGAIQLEQQMQNQQNLESRLSFQQQVAANQALFASSSPFSAAFLTNALRAGMTSTAFPSLDVEGFLFNVSSFLQNAQQVLAPSPEVQRQLPLRSRIADNQDEYLRGGGDVAPPQWQRTDPAPGTDPTTVPGGPVGSPAISPLTQLNQQSCMRGAQMGPSNMYGFGLVPYSPGQSQQPYGAFGKPLGGGAGPSGGSIGGSFAGVGGAGANVGGTVGLPFSRGAGGTAVAGAYAGQVPIATNTGLGSTPASIASIILGTQSLAGAGGIPGAGFGFRSSFSRSYGYTNGVGGSYGGAMGGSFGPGIGGGLGGYGATPYGNPAYPQYGNPLQQQFSQSPYGLPSGSPYGLGYGAPGQPTTSPAFRFNGGIAPDGTLIGSRGTSPIGVGGGGGFGTYSGGQTGLFGGGANMVAVAGLGSGVRGDGVFGMQALPGTFNPALQGTC